MIRYELFTINDPGEVKLIKTELFDCGLNLYFC